MRTTAAICRGIGTGWSVEEIELDPPRAGEVLITLAASGLCHSDDHLLTGDAIMPYPIIGGHEGAGVVTDVGPGVTSLVPGDHVVCSFIPACGRCLPCSTGHQNLCDMGALIGSGRQADGTTRHHVGGEDLALMCVVGTFSHHTVVNEASCVKIDRSFPLRTACLVGCGAVTGWGSAVYAAGVAPGDTVVVVGVGGIGAAAIQGARLAGAESIVAIDPVEFKRQKAKEFGAHVAFASMVDALEPLRELTRGRMASKVIMAMGVGRGDLFGEAMDLVGKLGRLVVTNMHPARETQVALSLAKVTGLEKQIVGSLFGSANPRFDIPHLLELHRKGQFDLDALVTRTYPLEGVNEGYRDMKEGRNIRGVLVLDEALAGART